MLIKKSISLIIHSKVKYEFRTTVYPKYVNEENVQKIASYLQSVGCEKYVLQNYYSIDALEKSYSKMELEKMAKQCSNKLPTIVKCIE